MAKLQKGVNDLKTWCLSNGDFGKQLMQEWTGECEDGLTYNIDEVAKASNKKFKWKCSAGHEWHMAICSYVKKKAKLNRRKLTSVSDFFAKRIKV